MKKILIIYSKTGGGHLSLALALKDALEDLPALSSSNGSIVHSQFSIVLFDPFPKIYASGYKTMGGNFQDLYGANYKFTDGKIAAAAAHALNFLVVGAKLIRVLKKEKPDVVITTHGFASMEIEKALKKINSKAKVVMVVADPFTPHAAWFTYKNADLYLSPTKEVTKLMVENGIDRDKIKTTGWLVRKEFREGVSNFRHPELHDVKDLDSSVRIPQNDEIRILRKILGLNETKFTIFLGGSGAGGGKIYDLAKLLAHSQLSIVNSQLIVVCGNNRQLMSKLMKLSEQNPGLFHLFPYVNNVRELMVASDVVVGKAGPNILFESIFMLKPFLATGCLPGQEEGNLEFIKRENLGWVKEEPAEAVELLEKLSSSNPLNPPSLAPTSCASRGGPISLITPNLVRVRNEHLNGSQNAATAIVKLLSA